MPAHSNAILMDEVGTILYRGAIKLLSKSMNKLISYLLGASRACRRRAVKPV
jgi:hypothetical protein